MKIAFFVIFKNFKFQLSLKKNNLILCKQYFKYVKLKKVPINRFLINLLNRNFQLNEI